MKVEVPAALVLAVAGAAPPLSKELTALVGQPISSVRSALVDDGWAPVETNLATAKGAPQRERGQAGGLLEAGFPEIERCTGDSRNYCCWSKRRARSTWSAARTAAASSRSLRRSWKRR